MLWIFFLERVVAKLEGMRIVLTGGTGYIGNSLTDLLLAQNDEVLILTRSVGSCAARGVLVAECSLDMPEKSLAPVRAFRPDVIVHLAALSSPNQCQLDPEGAWRANVEFTRLVCKLAEETQSFLCFASTDWIFNGSETPPRGYTEKDLPNPQSVYGVTKYTAEQLVLSGRFQFAVVRLALVYGPTSGQQGGFLQTLLNSFRRKITVELFEDEWRTPVFVEDVLRSLTGIIGRRCQGVFHCSGPDRISRLEMGKKFAKLAGEPEALIRSVTRAAQGLDFRPRDLSLNSEELTSRLGGSFTGIDRGLYLAAKKMI